MVIDRMNAAQQNPYREPVQPTFKQLVEREKSRLRHKSMTPNDVNKAALRQAQLEIMFEGIVRHQLFSKSDPPITEEWWLTITSGYDVEFVREQLNEMHKWLMSNPKNEKTNYRRFILNWMKAELAKRKQKAQYGR